MRLLLFTFLFAFQLCIHLAMVSALILSGPAKLVSPSLVSAFPFAGRDSFQPTPAWTKANTMGDAVTVGAQPKQVPNVKILIPDSGNSPGLSNSGSASTRPDGRDALFADNEQTPFDICDGNWGVLVSDLLGDICAEKPEDDSGDPEDTATDRTSDYILLYRLTPSPARSDRS